MSSHPPPPAPQPPDLPAPPSPDQVLYHWGAIQVTTTSVLIGHAAYPLAGTTWTIQDHTKVVSRTTPVGVVMALCFVWACGLGLLFLLLREDRVIGSVQISVSSPQVVCSAQVPLGSWDQAPQRATRRIAEIHQQVATVQALSRA